MVGVLSQVNGMPDHDLSIPEQHSLSSNGNLEEGAVIGIPDIISWQAMGGSGEGSYALPFDSINAVSTTGMARP